MGRADNTYGPISEGVTGSAGGGGRLISLGVDILGAASIEKLNVVEAGNFRRIEIRATE